MKQNLQNKVAIVTGASSGIGEATVNALIKEGVNVACVARRKDRLDALEKKLGKQVLPLIADVAVEQQVEQMVKKTADKWGHIDFLVANAGIMALGPVYNAKTEEWRNMVNINVLGLMYSIHQVLPFMTKQKSGHIVTLSSVAGRISFPNGAAYCATKYAVRAFSEGLRQEVSKDHIRVTIVEPGAVKTELAEQTKHPEARAFIDDLYSSIKPLDSEDIASAIVYALAQPSHVDVNEILIRPTAQVL